MDNRTLSEEIREANEVLAARIVDALKRDGSAVKEAAGFSDGHLSRRHVMKKCSHTAHHTLTELNITPLLDLAFVLLVIFIITTTPAGQ